VCSSRPVRQDYLEDLVWGHVMKLMADPGLIRAEIDRRLRDLRAANPVTAQKSRLELELSRCTRAKTRLVEAYQEELMSLEELRARMPDLRKKDSTLRAQLDSLEAETFDQETYVALAENLEKFLGRLRDGAKTCSIEERQRIVRLLVKEVLVDPERIVIRHSIPTRNPDSGGSYPLRRRSQDPTLGRAGDRLSAAGILAKDTRLEKCLDQSQDTLVPDPISHTIHKGRVVDLVEARLDVTLEHPLIGA